MQILIQPINIDFFLEKNNNNMKDYRKFLFDRF